MTSTTTNSTRVETSLFQILNCISFEDASTNLVTDVILGAENLQVLANSRRLTRKSSFEDSPGVDENFAYPQTH